MGKQKTVSGRKPGRPPGSGGRGRSRSKGNSSQSATPAAGIPQQEVAPKLKLKVNMGRDFSDPTLHLHPHATPVHDGDGDQQLAQPTPVTTRTGRTIHKPHHYDAVQGSEMDILVDQNSDDHRDEIRASLASDPSYVSHKAQEQFQQLPKRGERSLENSVPFGGTPDKVDEEDEEAPSSQTLQAQPSLAEPAHFVADEDAYAILNILRSSTKIFLDLPGLSNAHDPDGAQPWSAKALTQLYILCYHEQLWDLCDMIADTWIRAFHDSRTEGQRNAKYQGWRPNLALERRKRKAEEALLQGQIIPSEFDADPKDYRLVVTDPELDRDVTCIHTDLLNTLYDHTSPTCGARFLWADAVALYGDKAEKVIEGATRQGFALHPELLFNIMQTGLRMCRRKLTLKIEESTEGAWCKRYHEHGKNGQRCYRELASKNRRAEGDVEDADRDALDEVGDLIEAGLMDDEGVAKGMGRKKRGLADDGELSPKKRLRWEDEDAEGDLEED